MQCAVCSLCDPVCDLVGFTSASPAGNLPLLATVSQFQFKLRNSELVSRGGITRMALEAEVKSSMLPLTQQSLTREVVSN